jgi:hypothetical protein
MLEFMGLKWDLTKKCGDLMGIGVGFNQQMW